MKATVLVLANRTSASGDLRRALLDRAARGPARFDFVVPPAGPGREAREAAQRRLDHALETMRDAGLEVTGTVGEGDPYVSAVEAYDPRRHDEILVSTLPAQASHWLRIDLPACVGRATGALVHHVVAREPRPPLTTARPRPRTRQGMLTPFAALGWGGRPRTPA